MTTYDDLNDAGLLRERLARELAHWQAVGFVSGPRAWRFHRLVKRLARMVGVDVEDVMARLRDDATEIAAGVEGSEP